MKKKNVLALALAAGLVFGGTAYADGEQGIQHLKLLHHLQQQKQLEQKIKIMNK